MYCLLKWIKFSVKKTKHKKNTGKLEKNTGKVREKSGNFVSLEKWEPCKVFLLEPDFCSNCWPNIRRCEARAAWLI